MEIQDQFNKISDSYDARRRMFIPCFDSFYADTTTFIAHCVKPPKTVIDLGAGTGLLTSFWLKNIPEARYVLMDIAEAMLDMARQRFAGYESVSFEPGNYAEYLPPVNFDAAISALSIHHLEDCAKRKLFGNIHDRLPQGGLFVNYDQFCASSAQINSWFSRYWEDGLLKSGLSITDLALWRERQQLDRECSVDDEVKMLYDSGFESVECIFSCRKFAVIAAIK